MTPCRSNNTTSPLPSPLHSCLAEAPMQAMIWAGEAGQEQGQEEKVHDYGSTSWVRNSLSSLKILGGSSTSEIPRAQKSYESEG
ncbi:hypothetical protein AVEN_265839-1 [Araneus ventricosus]|uniref:Uncharacterized protein n=1 Tax=Araneus ventricosus TaxID=182803 RepID=A0A4Y2TAF3_ARAVE|nr:hypothetical protein AVEN_265839-1 [Araneus ventricosus]